jgi:hypothetical protein
MARSTTRDAGSAGRLGVWWRDGGALLRTGIAAALKTAPVLVAALLLGGCGTGVFTSTFAVYVDDPSDRLGPPPVQVSIFDPLMGSSAEWADRTMGSSQPGSAYAGQVDQTESRMAFDSSPPKRVPAALYLPAYSEQGYFALDLQPAAGQSQELDAPFVAFWSPEPGKVRQLPPLAVTTACTQADAGWAITLTAHIPEKGAG